MHDASDMLHFLPRRQLPLARRQLLLPGTAIVSTLLLLLIWQNQQYVHHIISATIRPSHEPLCRQLPGGEDVLVVMKTGASEVHDKLAVHLRTSMTCYPHSIIFSDVEEDLATGQHLYDAFKDTSPSLRDGNADFAIWRKLHAEGPQSLLPSELSGSDSRGKEEPTRMKIPGWKLDKWKFLPMMNQTYHMHPDKHWYVFVEADTYLLWSSLLADLATRSWTEDLYLGERVWIEDVRFAHGGSGFVLSRSALEKVANLYASNPSHWEEVTEHYWVGDHILAIALRDAGVQLKEGQPTWQGDPFSSLNLRPNGGLWCSTAVTSHHQQPSEIEDLWKLEQALISKAGTTESPELIRHRDIFKSYVLPRIQQPRTSWNNQPRREGHRMKDSKTENASDLLECEAICERDASCMQYTLHDGKDCETISSVILGEEADGFESGWMLERIMKNMEDPDAC